MRGAVMIALVLLALSARKAEAQVGSTRSFVSCPVYRDTDQGRKSGCWLADDPADGTRFDVTWAPIKPQEGHAVWVEGVVTAEPDLCGGVVLKPVRVGVLAEACPIVRLEPGPYKGRPSPPPVDVLAPTRVPRTLPPPPYDARTFTIYFEHGRDFLMYQHAEVILEKVQLYVKASKAQRVDIIGFAATEPLWVSGRSVREELSLGSARAEMAALALRRLGVPAAILHVSAQGAPMPADLEGGKLPESSRRRVVLTITP